MNTHRTPDLADLVGRWQRSEPDLVLHDPGGRSQSLLRAGQLVVPADAVERTMCALGRHVDTVVPADAAGLATLHLRDRSASGAVRLAADHAATLPVAPNHVHVGGTAMLGAPILHGTGARPEPAPLPPAPPRAQWDPPVTVAVLDTGLDPHPWFAGRPWLSDWGLQPEVLDLDDDALDDRQAGHGTFVAGVVVQHAPGVTLRHHRVLSSHGLTDDRTVAAALREVRQRAAVRGEHLDVVVLTAGCHTADDRCPPLLAREVSRFTGALVVAAAGNTGTTRPFWPAALPSVLAVGATGRDGALAPFSNRGTWVDVAAPGVDVVSSHVRLAAGPGLAAGTEAREYGGARWSGTSFAAPRVAGEVAALIKDGLSVTGARSEVRSRHSFEG